MRGNYQKFEINMVREHAGYRLWKQGIDEVTCFLETYKEKRSIFFSAVNLLPSRMLKEEYGMTYHLLLLGAQDGEVVHHDFGAFNVNQNGEGSCFHKFDGPELSCYTHCLFVASKEDSGQLEMVYRGETPFLIKAHPDRRWHDLFAHCAEQRPSDVFSPGCDETEAVWHRIDDIETLPEALAASRPLIEQYKHYILGIRDDLYYVGIPGRFLQREQPCRDTQVFLLWQPLRGGENFFDRPETMSEMQQEKIFGYWIAAVERGSGRLKSV